MQFYGFVSTNYGNTVLVRVYPSAGACDSWWVEWGGIAFLTLILLCFRSTVLEETHRRSLHISPGILQLTLLSNNNSNYHHVFLSLPLIAAFNEPYPIYNFQKTKKKERKIRTGRHWRHYPRELYPLPSCNAILLIEISVHHIRTVL